MAETYLMTLRAIVKCDDEVDAAMIADVIKTEGEKYLEEEDGDELFVSQITRFEAAVEPSELIDRLTRARNDLIRTRIKQCWDVAKQLDYVIYGLKQRMDSHSLESYNHGDFMNVAIAILERGEYPL